MESTPTKSRRAKHRVIYDQVYSDILVGEYSPGSRIPTEEELVKTFEVSRPTVGKAIRELEKHGLVYRKQGAGTFVNPLTKAASHKLGVLVPLVLPVGASYAHKSFSSLFSSLMSQVAQFVADRGHILLLNESPSGTRETIKQSTEAICRQLVSLQVKGVFFLPLEHWSDGNEINIAIANYLDNAGIATVLLDRDLAAGGNRSKYDIVSISNERAGWKVTAHLIGLGCRKIDFVSAVTSSSAIQDRAAGYRRALVEHGIEPQFSRTHQLDISTSSIEDFTAVEKNSVLQFVNEIDTDAVVCTNDGIAAMLMKMFLESGKRVPQDIRIVGFDDLPFAGYLPSPLTTVRQPAMMLAREAVRTLVDRIDNPSLPARDILVSSELIVRESCGSRLTVKS